MFFLNLFLKTVLENIMKWVQLNKIYKLTIYLIVWFKNNFLFLFFNIIWSFFLETIFKNKIK